MKVLSVVFNPFVNDSRVLKECRSLAKAGYSVQVAALHQEGLMTREVVSGICVERIALATRRLKGKIAKVLKYAEVAVKLLPRIRKVDIVHCNDLDPLPICIMAKVISGGRIKIVYDAHEFETEQKADPGMLSHWLMVQTEKFFIRYADAVITVSDSIAEEYAKRYKIKKPQVVLNAPYFKKKVKNNLFREKFGISSDTLIALYQGLLAPGRGIESLIEGFRSLTDRPVALVLLGYGPITNEVEKAARQVPNVFFHEAVPPDDVWKYTTSADIGVFFIPNQCLSTYYCLPNKLFEYTMAGLPVIVNDLFEVTKLVNQYRCGVVAPDCSPESIVQSLNSFIESDYSFFAENALLMARDFNWEEQEKVLYKVYNQFVVQRPHVKSRP